MEFRLTIGPNDTVNSILERLLQEDIEIERQELEQVLATDDGVLPRGDLVVRARIGKTVAQLFLQRPQTRATDPESLLSLRAINVDLEKLAERLTSTHAADVESASVELLDAVLAVSLSGGEGARAAWRALRRHALGWQQRPSDRFMKRVIQHLVNTTDGNTARELLRLLDHYRPNDLYLARAMLRASLSLLSSPSDDTHIAAARTAVAAQGADPDSFAGLLRQLRRYPGNAPLMYAVCNLHAPTEALRAEQIEIALAGAPLAEQLERAAAFWTALRALPAGASPSEIDALRRDSRVYFDSLRDLVNLAPILRGKAELSDDVGLSKEAAALERLAGEVEDLATTPGAARLWFASPSAQAALRPLVAFATSPDPPHTVSDLDSLLDQLRAFVGAVDLTSLEERPHLLEYRGPPSSEPDSDEMVLANLTSLAEEAADVLRRRQRQPDPDAALVDLETIGELAARVAGMPCCERFVVCGDHGTRMQRLEQLQPAELDEVVADLKLLLQEYPTRVSA